MEAGLESARIRCTNELNETANSANLAVLLFVINDNDVGLCVLSHILDGLSRAVGIHAAREGSL
jgi:hypothetical protein